MPCFTTDASADRTLSDLSKLFYTSQLSGDMEIKQMVDRLKQEGVDGTPVLLSNLDQLATALTEKDLKKKILKHLAKVQ